MREYDYEIRRGETFEHCFWVEDNEGKPVNLKNFHVRGQVREKLEAPTVAAEMACSIDVDTGCVSYQIPASVTKNIPPGLYFYDIALYQIENTTRIIRYMIGGKFRVLKAVTNALTDN